MQICILLILKGCNPLPAWHHTFYKESMYAYVLKMRAKYFLLYPVVKRTYRTLVSVMGF